ncbi:MAG: FAD-dependent oxidoreductase, partial [Geminicoccaceae bacterium]|nr:FAD-dependent oxidoreductase [Geminicoccaceae bacterium]
VGERILAAGGYSGHGISIGTLAGRILADAVGGRLAQFDVMAGLDIPDFPGGTILRQPLLVLAMLWGRLRDRLGR